MCNGWKGRTQPREEAHVIMTKCLREREKEAAGYSPFFRRRAPPFCRKASDQREEGDVDSGRRVMRWVGWVGG